MGEPLNLLLVEDSDLDARLLVYDLRLAGFEVKMRQVQTADEMRAALAEENWDAVISDFRLPSFNAPEALEIVRASGKDLPFLVVSGTIGEETAVQIMRAGAHDYLMKGNLNRLAEALRREIREARVREERRHGEVALRESEGRFRMLFERSNDAIFVVEKKTGRYRDANQAAEKLIGRTIDELKRLTIFDLSPNWARQRLTQLADISETVEFGEVTYLRPDGTVRTAQLSAMPIDDEIVFGIAHDITESKQAQATLERRAREMETLYATSLKINAQTDLLPLLNTIVEQAAGLLNAPMGGLYLMEPDGETLKLVVSYNLPGNYLDTPLRLGEGLSGRMALIGEPMMIPDYREWEGRARVYEQAHFRRVLGAPLKVKGKIIGAINVTDNLVAGAYSADEVRLLQLFADQAAIAVENTRLLEAAQHELNERRQAEVALRESEERYRTVVTGTQLVSFVLDTKGVFTLSEGKGLASLGLQPGEMVGKSALEAYQDVPSVVDSIRRALNGETTRSEDHIGEIFFNTTYAPFFDENGAVKGVIGVAIDITERKKSEEALRESEERFALFMDHLPGAVILKDQHSRTLYVNAYMNEVFGILDWIGKTPLELFPHEIGQLMIEDDQSALERGFKQVIETVPNRAGNLRIYETRKFLIPRSGQEPLLGAVAMDITEQKQAEQALQRQLKELTILHAIAEMAIRARTIDELIEFVTRQVGRVFYSDNFGFGFLDETENSLRPHPSYRGLAENAPVLFPVERSVTGSVAKSGKSRRLGDVTQVPDYLVGTVDVRSELCVPIKVGDRTIGVINAESKELDFFTEADERLMITIAGQMSTSIERFRLFEAERNRRREAETLREAIGALSASLELSQVGEVIINSIKQVVPFDSATIFLLEGDQLQVMLARGIPKMDELLARSFPADDPLFSETLRNGKLLILEDAQADPRFLHWGGTTYVHGWMAVPLIARGEVIGYITLDNRKKAAYKPEHASLAQAFANQAAIAIQNARLFADLQASLHEMHQAYATTIEGWSHALDLRDHETKGHTLRVTELTLKLARALGLSEAELVHVQRGALLHDMGKLGVPDRILLKPDKLTDEEWEIMRMHPQYAYEMLSPIAYLRPALDIPYSHHERWDGHGYPRGLKGTQIPLVARIFTVVDVWDALTSDRPYRPAWSPQATFEYMKKNAGVQFDPAIVEKFIQLWQEKKLST